MEARRRGYRQDGAAPPERGHPLANLTQPMSQSAHEPAPAPSQRQIPRRYLALGLIVVAIVLLGALVLVRDNSGTDGLVDGRDLQPGARPRSSSVAAVPASVFDTVGVDLARQSRSRPRGRPERRDPPLWQATVNGGPPEPVVFFYGAEFAPYAAAERWPLVLALSRFGTFTPARGRCSRARPRPSPTCPPSPSGTSRTRALLVLESVERYSSLNPTGARYSASRGPTPGRPRRSPSYGTGPTTFALLDVANRWVLDGAAFTPGVWPG